MSQIQKDIKETIETIINLDKVKSRYDQAVLEFNDSQSKLDKLHAVMVKELEDLNEIESKGLKPFFYKVLGSKEEQIEKERQEYLSASLKSEKMKYYKNIRSYQCNYSIYPSKSILYTLIIRN